MHGEKESLSGQRLFKDHSWRIAENSWVSGSENQKKKNCQTAPTSPHVVWEGFKKNSPSSSKNNLQHIQLSDMTGTSNGTGFYGQMKLKISFLAANTQDGFGAHRDKKVPHVYNEIYCCIFMLWAYISAGGPEHWFRHMASLILSNTNRYKINKWLTLLEIL